MSVVFAVSNECTVCEDPKPPADLLMLECGHFVCLRCLGDAHASAAHETFCFACEESTLVTSLPGSLVMRDASEAGAETPPEIAQPPAKRPRTEAAEDVLDPARRDLPRMRARLWDRYGWQLLQAGNVLDRVHKVIASVAAYRDRMRRELDEFYLPRIAMFEANDPQAQCRRLQQKVDDFFHKLLKPRQMSLEEVRALRERIQRKRDVALQLDCVGLAQHAGGLEWLQAEADDWDPLVLKTDMRSTLVNDETQCLYFYHAFFRRLAMKSAQFLGQLPDVSCFVN